MGNDFGAGTGDAFKVMNGGGSNSRRKRSTVHENAVLKAIFRAKRQTESDTETIEPNEKSSFQRIKEQFNHIMDAAQVIIQKIQQMRKKYDEAA